MIIHPFGVIIESRNGQLCFDLDEKRQSAAIVSEVVPMSAASRAGLEVGDHIISVNSDYLTNMSPETISLHIEEATRLKAAIVHVQRQS